MQNRSWVLATCAIVIAVVVLLVPALANLHFEPARPVSRASDILRPQILSALRIDDNTSVWEIMIVWLAAVIPLILVVLLLPPELRKRLLQHVIRFALFVLALVLALRYGLINLPEIESGEFAAGQAGSQMLSGTAETEAFTAPILPPWVIYLISFASLALLAAGTYLIYRLWRRTHSRRYSALSAIAAAARDSLDDLAEGRQWGDVVVQAYARMTDAVRVARGVHRDVAWTPREFAARLSRKGLPASAVDELTRLFEAARYGGAAADETARRRAADCLESILRACKAAA